MRLIRRYKFHFLLFVFAFLVLSRFQIDPDLGWHLAYGEHFLKTGEVLKRDIFSWTMPGYEWGNAYFLYELSVAILFRHLDFWGTAIVFGLLGAFATFVILPRKLNWVQALLVLLGTTVGVGAVGVRPSMISYLMAALLFFLLGRGFSLNTRFAFFWFTFFALWANFHQGFLVGLLLFAVFVVVDAVFNKRSFKDTAFLKALLMVGVVFLSAFLTPYNFYILRSVFFDLSGSGMWFYIAEWQPVAFYFPTNMFMGLTGFLFVFVFFKNFKRLDPRWFIVFSLAFMLPFLAAVFAPFWAAAFVYFAPRYLKFTIELTKANRLMLGLVVGCAAAAFFLSFATTLTESVQTDRRLASDNYPVEAVKFLKEQGLTEGVFNQYAWGGYIDWQAAEIPVFIDGRMTGWRKAQGGYILRDYLDISRGRCDGVSEYDIRVVLIEKGSSAACFANFIEVYSDEVAKVLVRE